MFINKLSFLAIMQLLLLFSMTSTYCQENVYHELNHKHINEKIFLETGRSSYIAGDQVYYGVHLFNLAHQTCTTSKVGYLILKSQSGNFITGQKIHFKEGAFSGKLYLPDTLSTGLYQIAAYNNWMKNFKNPPTQVKNIFIANRFDNNLDYIEKAKVQLLSDKEYEVEFSPEGGNILANKPNQLEIKIQNRKGYPVTRNAVITNESKDTLQKFNLNNKGIGKITFTPSINNKYYLEFTDLRGNNQKAPLPNVLTGKTNLVVDSLTTNNINFTIQKPDSIDNRYNLMIKHHKTSLYQKALSKKTNSISINRNKLPYGALKAYLLHDKDTISKTTFTNTENFIKNLKITTSKKTYNPREMVNVQINLPKHFRDSILYLTASVVPLTGENIRFYNYDNNNSFYSTLNNTFHKQEKWHKYNLSNNLKAEARNLPENYGNVVKGEVINKKTKAPAENVLVYLSAENSIANLKYTRTNNEGIFYFKINSYYENKNVHFILPEKSSKDKFQISIDDQINFNISNNSEMLIGFPDDFKSYLEKSQKSVRVKKIYENKNSTIKPNSNSLSHYKPYLYSSVDFTLNPKNYARLENFYEISKNLIPHIKIRETDSTGYRYTLFDQEGKPIEGTPLGVFIDGVPVSEINDVIQYGTKSIDKIQINKSIRYYGDLKFGGVLALQTRDHSGIKNHSWNNPHLSTRIRSYANHYEHVNPDYSTNSVKSSTIPDVRQLLYWNVNLLSNSTTNFKFYISDLPGNYQIKLKGYTKNGTKIKITDTFEVIQNTNP